MTIAVRSTTRTPVSGPVPFAGLPIISLLPSSRSYLILLSEANAYFRSSGRAALLPWPAMVAKSPGSDFPQPRRQTMDFSLTADQQNIREAILKLCSRFPDPYWLERDREGGFSHGFYKAVVEGGWLGIAMPSEFGGSGLGITEAAVMMQAIAESGAGGRRGGAGLHPHPSTPTRR